jgi:tetratricopeptide (TPR) repeat protein
MCAVEVASRHDGRWRDHGWAWARVDFAHALRLHARGRLGRAQRLAEKAVSRDPGYAEARVLLARTLFARGDRVAARHELARAVAAQPWNQWARLESSRLLAEAGFLGEALHEAEAAMDLGVLLSEPFLQAGRILAEMGNCQQASTVLRRALEVDPESHEVATLLADLGAS